ncbi:protein of unknown function [Streptomyces sp. 2224.1]|uniref:DUF397 domain-containing protein n=1 Tax=unclassified Streptomyces TaxID=2593676 RepID=UPI0008983572|nr:protein of unknown function [Streptomyces sp. 2224.1]SEE75479.1 protein of unknown function [Streptomyces sp. 2112.3]
MKTIPNPAALVWRKSSYSNGGDANCVEVSDGFPGAVPVRDSKNPAGGVLLFPDTAWSGFMATVKDGRLLSPAERAERAGKALTALKKWNGYAPAAAQQQDVDRELDRRLAEVTGSR